MGTRQSHDGSESASSDEEEGSAGPESSSLLASQVSSESLVMIAEPHPLLKLRENPFLIWKQVLMVASLSASPWLAYQIWVWFISPKTPVRKRCLGVIVQVCLAYGLMTVLAAVGLLLLWMSRRQIFSSTRRRASSCFDGEGEEARTNYAALAPRIIGECFLTSLMLVPGCGLALLLSWLGSWHKVPPYIWVFAICVALRSKKREASMAHSSIIEEVRADFTEWQGFPSFPFMSTVTESIQGFSKGTAIINALVIDDQLHEYFLSSFTGILPSFVHLWMCLLLAAIMSAVFKVGMIGIFHVLPIMSELFTSTNADGSKLVIADGSELESYMASKFGGFGGLARYIVRENPNPILSWAEVGKMHDAIAFRTKIFGDAVLSLYWQTQVVMCLGMTPDVSTVIPICISALLVLKGVLGHIASWVAIVKKNGFCWGMATIFEGEGQIGVVVFGYALIVSYAALKGMYMAHVCPSHRWSYFVGCVPVANGTMV